MDDDKSVGSKSEMKPNTKEQYVKPELTVHGTVQELTQALGTPPGDGLIGSQLL
jgi:hypothetical protein